MLHILQGGLGEDRKHLERAALRKSKISTWITPKSATAGDEAVIFLGSGFFATASIASETKPRSDWPNRYGASLRSIRLIDPPISLGVLRQEIPELTWAIYPRSVTTTTEAIARKIKKLIDKRRNRGGSDVRDELLDIASEEEARARAIADARPFSPKKVKMAFYYARSSPVHRAVLLRSRGSCEGCGEEAPFKNRQGAPYLEPHHTIRVADKGRDSLDSVIALCPSCHRRVHCGLDGEAYNERLIAILKKLEKRSAAGK